MDNNNFCSDALKQAVAKDRELEGEIEIQFSRRSSSRRRNPLSDPQVSPANGPPETLLGLFQEGVLGRGNVENQIEFQSTLRVLM